MSIVNTLALESNRQIKINFDGGDLSCIFYFPINSQSFNIFSIASHAANEGFSL